MRRLIPLLMVAACGRDAVPIPHQPTDGAGIPRVVTDTLVADVFEAAGIAEPVRTATLSTRLMGTVLSVSVQEGEWVEPGQVLVRLDARDLEARRAQAAAGLAEATAVHRDATVHATRMRALYADSAATRAQLDQAETGLARAEAALATARAMGAEVAATASYSEVRAPFAGIVTRRFVDPGAFAAPGTPLVAVEDAGTLRVSVHAAPEAVRGLGRGAAVLATIGDTTVRAAVEGVVPAGPNLYTVNALVRNAGGRILSGSAATLALPRGLRRAVLVDPGAVVRQGNLTGVHTLTGGNASLRWVRLGSTHGAAVEVLSGLAPGDTVLVARGES